MPEARVGFVMIVTAAMAVGGLAADADAAKRARKPVPGAASGEEACAALLGALVAGDQDAARRVVPDRKACSSAPKFEGCPTVVDGFGAGWADAVAALARYRGATFTRAKEPPPFPKTELYAATMAGKEPLLCLTVKAGKRHFAILRTSGPTKPPSTGNEMPDRTPAMRAEEARKAVDRAVARFEKGPQECEAVVNELQAALPVAFPEDKVVDAALPPLRALARCAHRTARWRAAVAAGSLLLETAPDDREPAAVVRALAELGEYERAVEMARAYAKRFPRAEAMLSASLTFVLCRAERYDGCEATAGAALEGLAKMGVAPTDDSVLVNRSLRAMARIATGRPQESLVELAELARLKPAMAPLAETMRVQAELAIERGFYLEVVPLRQLPMGVYHLMGKKDTGALVTIKLREHAGTQRTFRIEAEVPGVTERSSSTVILLAKGVQALWVAPPLKFGFDPSVVRGPRPSQLAVRVIETTGGTQKAILDETVPLEVLPRDYLPLKRKLGADSMVPTFGYLGAWITSNDKTVESFLVAAKEKAPGRAFVGEQDATVPQVRALYETLKARGVSYVMDPDVTSDQHFVQRTRLPGEVLATTNAQCLEGALLFATLFEAIGLQPIVVFVPGHAFVGWKTVAADGVASEPLFLETTMVGTAATFDEAVTVATRRVVRERRLGSFRSGAATMVDVAEIRKSGFTAQPY